MLADDVFAAAAPSAIVRSGGNGIVGDGDGDDDVGMKMLSNGLISKASVTTGRCCCCCGITVDPLGVLDINAEPVDVV